MLTHSRIPVSQPELYEHHPLQQPRYAARREALDAAWRPPKRGALAARPPPRRT